MLRKFRRLVFWFGSVFVLMGYFYEDATANSNDDKALQELNSFMFDSVARQDNAKGNANAQAAENNFAKFPKYAQDEMNEIIMMIMKEMGEDAGKLDKVLKQQGGEATFNNFSKPVQTRIKALSKRLAADKSFKK